MKTTDLKYCYLILFAMLYLTADIASNTMIYRMIKIGPIILSAGMLVFAITYFCNDIVAEIYGYKYARYIIWFDLLCSTLFSLFANAVLSLPYPHAWSNESSFEIVFGHLMWISLGCIIAAIVSEFLNIYIFAKLKIIMKGRFFAIRSMLSSAGGQLTLVIVCIPMYFWHQYSVGFLIELTFVSYLFLLIFTAIMAIPLSLLTQILKHSIGLNTFDYQTNFNPFVLNNK